MFGYSREAVRVKVKKCEGKLQPELRKFSVDPQITSLEVLQSILIKAFDIRSDFTLSFRSLDDLGQEIYLPLLSDWDLDAAFLRSHNIALSQRSEPCVQLKVDMKPFAEASEDWEPPSINSIPTMMTSNMKEVITVSQKAEKSDNTQMGFQGLIMNQVEKTFNIVSRALNLHEDPNTAPRLPLNDVEFRSLLDAVGQITNISKLREIIYCGGIEPSLRKVVWKHILNVYPDGMTGKERMDYIKKKANEYYTLRSRWKECIQTGKANANLAYVTSMVRKDVLRTDRHHKFYAGSDDNQNIASLFNILTTYALNHPTVSYCQGMSDLASPLLVTMGDEAHAYICLCALMSRLYPNFLLDGEAMTLKFTHLTECLQVYDPEFYNYLKLQQADDLLFCYRWLLLEMKREFAFDDALRMLEVLWASLPQKSTSVELHMKEKEFNPNTVIDVEPPPVSPLVKTPRENAYTKVCAIRRQSSSFSLAHIKAPKLATCKQMNHSLDESINQNVDTSILNIKEFQSLDDGVLHMENSENCDERVTKESFVRAMETKVNIRRNMKSVPENGKENKNTPVGVAWASTNNLVNGSSLLDVNETPLGSQIRLLRDKISVHNKYFSLDKLNISESDVCSRPKVKMIKNLNEFLNLATGNKSGRDNHKLQRTQSATDNSDQENPKISLTQTSLNESSSVSPVVAKNRSNLFNKGNKSHTSENNDGSSPDDSQEYYPMTTSMTRELRLELEHLDRQVFGSSYINSQCNLMKESPSDSPSTEEQVTNNVDNSKQDCLINNSLKIEEVDKEHLNTNRKSSLLELTKHNARSVEDIYLWENPLHKNIPVARATASCPHTPDEQAELDFDVDTGEIVAENSGKKSVTPIRLVRRKQSLKLEDLQIESKHSNTHSSDSDSSEKDPQVSSNCITADARKHVFKSSKTNNFFSSMSQELENAKRNCETLLSTKQSSNINNVAATINNFQRKYEVTKSTSEKGVNPARVERSSKNSISSLPPPHEFGSGNPFLMFLCVTLLMQHRDYIMRNRMDYNELAMHFDKMVRKHNVNRVLNQARQMYAVYLKHQTTKSAEIPT